MVLHGELYRLRPPARSLTAFYLCTSGGGALGGLAVGLVAPRVFDGFYELPIGLGARLRAAARRVAPRSGGMARRSRAALALRRGRRGRGRGRRSAGLALLDRVRRPAPSGAQLLRRAARRDRRVQRRRTRRSFTARRCTASRSTGSEDKATTYYGLHTGIEIALKLREPDAPIEVGVIGLGAGTLAAYGRPGTSSASSRSTPP